MFNWYTLKCLQYYYYCKRFKVSAVWRRPFCTNKAFSCEVTCGIQQQNSTARARSLQTLRKCSRTLLFDRFICDTIVILLLVACDTFWTLFAKNKRRTLYAHTNNVGTKRGRALTHTRSSYWISQRRGWVLTSTYTSTRERACLSACRTDPSFRN